MMNTLKYIKRRLNNRELYDFIVNCYSEKHRFYHTMNHIVYLIDIVRNTTVMSDELFYAILFHDIIYDPLKDDNEYQSALLYKEKVSASDFSQTVYDAIIDTKTHKATNKVSEILCQIDLSILYGSFTDFMTYEDQIFKEFQFVDYSIYIQHRIPILERYNVNPLYIEYVKNRKVNIGIYPGSFNPFHKGHINILSKAEQIFDKVIIAQGINKEKNNKINTVNHPSIKYHQKISYDGMLTDLLDTLSYKPTVIRGLRNASDLQYETTQYRYLTDLSPDIKVVSILCDSEYEHISSSAIRLLESYNKNTDFYI